MIQGGVEGMYHWLKLDQKYLETHCSEICNYASINNIDIDDPYMLLWTLLEYTGASSKPWLHPTIDPKAINDLAVDAQMGSEESRELLVLYLYKLASKTANRFSWSLDRFAFDRSDLIHQGLLGIYTALEKWTIDEDKDFAYWAQMHMFSSIQVLVTTEAPMVKLPYHQQMLKGKLPKIRKELEELLERPASWEELAWYIRAEGYDIGINRMMEAPELALLEATHVSSLNQVINDDEFEYTEVMDTIADDGTNLLKQKRDPIKELEYREIFELLMDKLNDTERFVIMNYSKGHMGDLSGSEVAAELADREMTGVTYTNAAISSIFERACIKMKFAAKEMDLTKDIIFG